MATSNFGRPNASYYYTFAMDIEDSDLFDYLYDLELTRVRNGIQNALQSSKDNLNYIIPKGSTDNCIAVLQFMVKSKDYPANDYLDEVQLRVVIKYGYYEGAMIDRELTHDIEDLSKTTQKKITASIKRLEKILAKHTTPMVRVGGFSDGTSVYQVVNK